MLLVFAMNLHITFKHFFGVNVCSFLGMRVVLIAVFLYVRFLRLGFCVFTFLCFLACVVVVL